jgi:cell wall assembly regulator SMI1
MNPDDPVVAQQIVAEYARRLARDLETDKWPAEADALPYPKQAIKAAIRTSVVALATTGQFTDELREFLETAYVSLADYVASDLARLLSEYQQAGTDLATDRRLAREKTAGSAWQTVAESGAIVGEVARMVASEAETLRAEFRVFAQI